MGASGRGEVDICGETYGLYGFEEERMGAWTMFWA
jgi:hypothetical protein